MTKQERRIRKAAIALAMAASALLDLENDTIRRLISDDCPVPTPQQLLEVGEALLRQLEQDVTTSGATKFDPVHWS